MSSLKQPTLYVCPVCFRECDSPEECHSHRMLECYPGRPDSFRRKPICDETGNIMERAPLWFLEASGWLMSIAPYTLWRH